MRTPVASVAFDRAGTHLTVYVSGELDQATAPELAEQIADRVHAAVEVIWLDLAAVTFCGSAGISLLVALHQQAEDQGAQLTLYSPSAQVRNLLDMMHLDQLRVWTDARSTAPEPTPD